MINPTATRERLTAGAYKTVEPGNPLGLLQETLEIAEQIKPIERRVFDARRQVRSRATTRRGRSTRPSKGIITAAEAESLRAFDRKVLEVTGVDDFDPEYLARAGR